MRAIGLMSGTSLDGMDAALIESDGKTISAFGPVAAIAFESEDKNLIQKAVDEALHWRFKGNDPASFEPAANVLTDYAIRAVKMVLEQSEYTIPDIDVIGFHGQTLIHQPPRHGKNGQTCQIGNAQMLADAFCIPVVYGFRSLDMAAGGHGAPLAPAYHKALAADLPKPLMILNLGGVGNLTWLGENGQILAFDTGPGNGPLDAWIQRHDAGDMDRDGNIAAVGSVDEARVQALMDCQFFWQRPPKSVDRWDFDETAVQEMSLEDGAATLSAFCAQSIADALRFVPERPKSLLVCGGGRHNPVLTAQIASRTGLNTLPVEAKGWRGDALEAEAFAYLAIRRVLDMPTSWPQTTGVKVAICGGAIAAPS